MERPLYKPIGTPAGELDTPALVLSLETLERNIAQVHSSFQSTDAKIRPFVSTHRCPALAHLQLNAEGTRGGIAVANAQTAEVFAHAGFRDILIVHEVVTPTKIDRLCAVSRNSAASITLAVDNSSVAARISDAAVRYGTVLHLAADVDVGYGRAGVESGQPLLDLVKSLHTLPGVQFAGLLGYEPEEPADDPGAQAERSAGALSIVSAAAADIAAAGYEPQMVATGCSADYRSAAETAGVTDVLAGAYCVMDERHRYVCPKLRPAVRVVTTIAGRPEPTVAIGDCGHKAIGGDTGMPVVQGVAGVKLARMSAEHGVFEVDPADGTAPAAAGADAATAAATVGIGDVVDLIPHDAATAFNSYDMVHATRDGLLHTVWKIGARGAYG